MKMCSLLRRGRECGGGIFAVRPIALRFGSKGRGFRDLWLRFEKREIAPPCPWFSL
jgi:hypothetical protein